MRSSLLAHRRVRPSLVRDVPNDPRMAQGRLSRPAKDDFVQSMVQLALSTKHALAEMPETLLRAQHLLSKAAGCDFEEEPLPIPCPRHLRRHLLWLDDALDCYVRDNLDAAKA